MGVHSVDNQEEYMSKDIAKKIIQKIAEGDAFKKKSDAAIPVGMDSSTHDLILTMVSQQKEMMAKQNEMQAENRELKNTVQEMKEEIAKMQ
jgi:N-acetylglutamate synthase/N-acetylornithine aminotransferase